MASELGIKSAEDIREDYLRVVRNAARQRGLAPISVSRGSDQYLIGSGLANQVEPLYAAIETAGDRFMPDTTTGADEERWLKILFDNQGFRPAGPSSGEITYEATAPTAIVEGEQLIDPNGAIVEVVTGGTYDDGDLIPVQSNDVGINTNIDGGSVLTWVNPPPFSAPTATVTDAGMTGGVDIEDEETARERLLERLGDPPNGANASSFSGWAEDGSTSVQRAFVYPAANGPATTHVACVGYASTSTTKSRAISSTALANATANVIANANPGIEVVVTVAGEVQASVSFYIEIPASVNAVPAGTGGGWVDGVPFPQPGASADYCSVKTVTSTTNIVIENSLYEPSVDDTFGICWLSYSGTSAFKLYTATATVTATSGAGPYDVTVTLDKPLIGISTGNYIWPQCANQQGYVDAILEVFAKLGPGEKTDAAGLLPYAYRRPRYFDSWDYRIGAQFLKALTDIDEVLDASWGHQNNGTTSPPLPASIDLEPNIFIPQSIAFYPAT